MENVPNAQRDLLQPNHFLTKTSFNCQTVKESFIAKGKLILVLDYSQKIIITGKSIDTSSHRNRIREILSIAAEKRFDIREKSVKHYAKEEKNEYVLVKW